MPLKFLIIAPTPFYENRGCHLRIRGEAEALLEMGHKITVVTYKEGEDLANLPIKRAVFSLGKFGKGVSSSWINIPNGIFLFGTALRLCLKERPEVIYCHLHEGVAIGFCIKILSRLLSLFTYNPLLVFDGQGGLVLEMKENNMIKSDFAYGFFNALEKLILHFPDLIFVSSRNFYLSFQEKKSKTKTVFLPDTISVFNLEKKEIANYKRTKEEKIKILSLLKKYFEKEDYNLLNGWIKEEKTIILYSGSFSKTKGFLNFREKILSHLANDKGIRFLFGGGNKSEIPGLKELKQDRIVFINKLDALNLKYFLMLGDVGADPKPIDTFEASGKILNYMVAGLPVVCFDQPNNHYFLDKEGLYAKNEDEFYSKIEELASNKEKRQSIGKRNLDRVFANFTKETAGKIIETEIKKLIKLEG